MNYPHISIKTSINETITMLHERRSEDENHIDYRDIPVICLGVKLAGHLKLIAILFFFQPPVTKDKVLLGAVRMEDISKLLPNACQQADNTTDILFPEGISR